MFKKLSLLVLLLVCGVQLQSCPTINNSDSPGQIFQPLLQNLQKALDPSNNNDSLSLMYFNRQETENVVAFRYIFKLNYNSGKLYYVAILSTAPLGQEQVENHQIIRFLQSSDIKDSIKLLGIWDLKEKDGIPCLDLRERFWQSWTVTKNQKVCTCTSADPSSCSCEQSTSTVVSPAASSSYHSILASAAMIAGPKVEEQTSNLLGSLKPSSEEKPSQDSLIEELQKQMKAPKSIENPLLPSDGFKGGATVSQGKSSYSYTGSDNNSVSESKVTTTNTTTVTTNSTTETTNSTTETTSNGAEITPEVLNFLLGSQQDKDTVQELGKLLSKVPIGNELNAGGKVLSVKYKRKNDYKIGSVLSGTGKDKIMNPVPKWSMN